MMRGKWRVHTLFIGAGLLAALALYLPVTALPNGAVMNRGYFTGTVGYAGAYGNVLYGCNNDYPISEWMESPEGFISGIKSYLYDGIQEGCGTTPNALDITRNRTGAEFIIQTMRDGDNPPSGGVHSRPTAADVQDWENRVYSLIANGGTISSEDYAFAYNSGYMSNFDADDDAFNTNTGTFYSLVFRDGSGDIVYSIKYLCGNTNGGSGLPPAAAPPTWDMNGQSKVVDPVTNTAITTALPGQVVRFTHSLQNVGPDQADDVSWTTQGSVGTPASSGSSGSYPGNGSWKLVHTDNATIPATATNGQKLCQRIRYNPSRSNPSKGQESSEYACVTVVSMYELKPSVTVAATTLVGNDTIFTFAIGNLGPTPSSQTAVSIREIIIPSGVTFTRNIGGFNDDMDCAYYRLDSGVICNDIETLPKQSFAVGTTSIGTRTVSTAGRNPGDRVCRVLSVWSRDHTTPLAARPWHNRDQVSCTVIAAAPFLAVTGGDISAGGGIISQCPGQTNPNPGDTNADGRLTLADCAGSPEPAPTIPCVGQAGYQGSQSSLSFATPFGSFSDYALMATAEISSFASGGQFDPVGSRYLSFANAGLAAGKTTGWYRDTHCITDYSVAYRDIAATVSPSTPAALWSTDGVRKIDDAAFEITGATITAGKRYIIYAPTSNITISGNITYNATTTAFGQIPSVVIIAKKILITSNVTELNGTFYAAELISTCKEATDVAANKVLASTASIAAGGVCRNSLTVNGSLITKKLLTLRIAGGTNAATPAEVVRFRPNVFLSAYESGGAPILTVDLISELPPRN